MLKPMGKKHEWCGAPSYLPNAAKLPAHLRPLLVPDGAALRLQLRYQKYQDKVRTLLKKTDASQQQELTAKASSRVVATSSIALAIALQNKDTIPDLTKYAAVHPKSEWMEKWTLTLDWTRLQHDTRPFVSDSEVESDGLSVRQHGFVNVMEPSWLLSSIEQRCATTARSLTTHRWQPSLLRQLTDLRLAVLDLLFIFRAGTDVNLRGRRPSSVKSHFRHLLARMNTTSASEREQVTHIFKRLQSDMVLPAVRCLGWLLTKTWRLLFEGLHVDVESLHQVRRVLEASEGDVSVVFAPTHKSHLDYLIISYVCFAYGIPLPRIAAGDNLDLPLVGPFLRANGSFFIRRSFRTDRLYKEVLEQYVYELLDDGNPIEVFVEGGRSRHGRVGKPRLGFLSMLRKYVSQSGCSDEKVKKTVLIVPISLDYDKVYEVNGYADQLLGKVKEKESIGGLCRSVWDLFFLRLGHSYVRFGEPVSLTDTSLLENTADLVAERMQTSGTITSTAMVSALLMWKRAYMTETMLESRTLWLVNELKKRKATVAHVEINDITAHALSILNVKTEENGVITSQLQDPVRALEFGFYRNHLLHVFLPEMAVYGAFATVLHQCSNCDKSHGTQRSINIVAVKQEAQQIWRFLRHICRHASIDIDARVDEFLAESFECHVDKGSDTVVVDVSKWKKEKLVSFVLSLNWSFMDSWWLTTQGLWSLFCSSNDIECTEHEIVRRVQLVAKELLVRQQLFHSEALCSESIKQTLDYYLESNVVRSKQAQDGTSRVLQLNLDVKALDKLTREANARRKPHVSLWRQDELSCNLTRKEVVALMEGDGST